MDEATGVACRDAYDRTLAKHHSFIVRKGAHVAMYTLPVREQLLRKVSCQKKTSQPFDGNCFDRCAVTRMTYDAPSICCRKRWTRAAPSTTESNDCTRCTICTVYRKRRCHVVRDLFNWIPLFFILIVNETLNKQIIHGFLVRLGNIANMTVGMDSLTSS